MRHTNFNFPSGQTLLLGFIMIHKFAYTNRLFILIKSCILKNEAKSLNLIAISICIVSSRSRDNHLNVTPSLLPNVYTKQIGDRDKEYCEFKVVLRR